MAHSLGYPDTLNKVASPIAYANPLQYSDGDTTTIKEAKAKTGPTEGKGSKKTATGGAVAGAGAVIGGLF